MGFESIASCTLETYVHKLTTKRAEIAKIQKLVNLAKSQRQL